MPALLKGFFEQALRPGSAFAYRPDGGTERLLDGRSARIIITMGMPAWVFSWIHLGHGVKVLSRTILGLRGIAPVRTRDRKSTRLNSSHYCAARLQSSA